MAWRGKKSFFSLETDEETLIGNLNYLDPNYNFLGNSIGYSLYSSSNDKPNQGYENSLIGAGINTRFEQFKNIYTRLGFNAVMMI